MPGLTPVLLAATAISTIGQSISSAISQRAAGEARKAQFEVNARLANLQAEDALDRGDKAAGEYAKRVKKIIGAQRAAFAGQGVDVNIGSPLEFQVETAEFGAVDVLQIRNNAFREAWGLKVQALDLSTRGAFASIESKAKARNTLLTGGLDTLNLATSYYSDFDLSSSGKSTSSSSGSSSVGDFSGVPALHSPDFSPDGFGFGGDI